MRDSISKALAVFDAARRAADAEAARLDARFEAAATGRVLLTAATPAGTALFGSGRVAAAPAASGRKAADGARSADRSDLKDADEEDDLLLLLEEGEGGEGEGSVAEAAHLAAALRAEAAGAMRAAGGSELCRRGLLPAGAWSRQVVFASRTHSQVAQFVRELRRTALRGPTRLVHVGSRRLLCVNEAVLRLGSDARMSDRCLQLRDRDRKAPAKPSAASGRGCAGGCPFAEPSAVDALATRLAGRAGGVDVEEAAAMGREMGACPYYAVRRALPVADVVALPYTSLVSASAREAVGLRLRGSVVVVDEAHNLAAAALAANSASLSGSALAHAAAQLDAYLRRYRARLRGRNIIMCSRLAALLRALHGLCQRAASADWPLCLGAAKQRASAPAEPRAAAAAEGGVRRSAQSPSASGVWLVRQSELWAAARVEHLDMPALLCWAEGSGLCRKLRGFVDAGAAAAAAADAAAARGAGKSRASAASSSTRPMPARLGAAPATAAHLDRLGAASAMQTVCGFLAACLAGGEEAGRVLVTAPRPPPAAATAPAAAPAQSRQERLASARLEREPWAASPGAGAVTIKFSLVSAAAAVRSLFSEPRSVLLAGGTMPPLRELRQQLFPAEPEGRVRTFQCGHVVGSEALCGAVLRCGPAGRPFDFSRRGRSGAAGDASLADLGEAVLRFAAATPGGVVVFFPSYAVEEKVVGLPGGLWRRGGGGSILSRLGRPVFREPRAGESVEALLERYAAACTAGAAVLFAVVGGKLSEGIDFKDALCRAVVVVGMPYPNLGDPELRERMAAADSAHGAGAGRELYESLCMQAVSQSVGRAVRHRGDWAAVVLADARYAQARVRAGLPAWLQPHVADFGSFAQAHEAVTRFLRRPRP